MYKQKNPNNSSCLKRGGGHVVSGFGLNNQEIYERINQTFKSAHNNSTQSLRRSESVQDHLSKSVNLNLPSQRFYF